MVDALREARRVLKPRTVLVNLQPLTMPLTVEVMIGIRSIWSKEIASYSAPEDVAAAESAIDFALFAEWFAFEKSLPYHLDIWCDTAADLRVYAQARKLSDAEIPYDELEKQRLKTRVEAETARLRCRRPWKLSVYRKEIGSVTLTSRLNRS